MTKDSLCNSSFQRFLPMISVLHTHFIIVINILAKHISHGHDKCLNNIAEWNDLLAKQ